MFNLSNNQFKLPKPGSGGITKNPSFKNMPSIQPKNPQPPKISNMPSIRPKNGSTGFGNTLKPM